MPKVQQEDPEFRGLGPKPVGDEAAPGAKLKPPLGARDGKVGGGATVTGCCGQATGMGGTLSMSASTPSMP